MGLGGGVKKFNLIVNYTPFIGLKYIFNSYLEQPFKAPVQIIKAISMNPFITTEMRLL